MNYKLMSNSITSFFSKNKSELMIGAGIAGLLYSVYSSGKASVDVYKKIEVKKEEQELEKLETKEILKIAAPVLGPVIVSSIVCTGMIFYAYNSKVKQYAALTAAYSLLEKDFDKYRDSVIKLDKERKTFVDDDVKKDLAAEEILKNPPTQDSILQTGNGDTLCFDKLSGRYFRSSADFLRRSEVAFEKMIIRNDEMNLNEWYDEIGLPTNGLSDDYVFEADRDFELAFSSHLRGGEEPCLAVSFRYPPKYRGRM